MIIRQKVFDKMSGKHLGICIVAYPISKAFSTPLLNMEEILYSLSNTYSVIGSAENVMTEIDKVRIQTYKIQHKITTSIFVRILRYVLLEIRVSLALAKLSKKIDLCIFFMDGDALLPILTTKLLRKKVILELPSSFTKMVEFHKDFLSAILSHLKVITYALSNRIVLYSPNLVKEWKLEKHKDKILIAHEHFLHFDKFKMKKKFGERDNLVGYIGRLSEEKGTLNFVKAIPEISKEKEDMKFLLGGNGQLKDEIEEYLNREYLNGKVKLAGWIPHDELPEYLNEFKLVVLPSYTEGLPNVILEAMACGTPVLATPVGAIPDIIKDGETGFIMEDNSPECIAKNIVRALNHPDLEKIAENGRRLVEREFTFGKVVERWKKILEQEI